MSSSSKEFTLQPLVLSLQIIPDQLYVWHRDDRKRPSIFLRIPEGGIEGVRRVGLKWATLELGIQPICQVLEHAQGMSEEHRRVRMVSSSVTVHTTYILNNEEVLVVTMITNLDTKEKCALRISLQAAAVDAATRAYRQFAYGMRTMLALRYGPGLTTGPDDSLLGDLVDAIDYADKELNERYWGLQSTQPTKPHVATTMTPPVVATPAPTSVVPLQADQQPKASAAKPRSFRELAADGKASRARPTIAEQLAANGLVPSPVDSQIESRADLATTPVANKE